MVVWPIPLNLKSEKYLTMPSSNGLLFPKNTFSIGRAGTYRYEVDIDDCIWQALEIKKIISENNWEGPVVGDEFKINW